MATLFILDTLYLKNNLLELQINIHLALDWRARL